MLTLLKYWRELLIAILVLIILLGAKQCSKLKDNEQVAVHKQDSAFTVIKKHELKNGELANQVQVHEVTKKQLENDLGLTKDSVKHLRSQIGPLTNLVGYWKGKIQVKDTFKTTLHDTVYRDKKGTEFKGKDFKWNQSKYLSLEGFIPSDFTSISIAYKYNPEFTLVAYRKPRPFSNYLKLNFKQMPLVADLTFNDPNVVVQKFTGVVIKEEPKKWYQTTLFKIGVGAVLGVEAGRRLLWK